MISKEDLEKYEEICPDCKGQGMDILSIGEIGWICRTCYGTGKIDWIDKIRRSKIYGIKVLPGNLS